MDEYIIFFPINENGAGFMPAPLNLFLFLH